MREPSKQALEVARKIDLMASKPVDDIMRHMKIVGFKPEYMAIVLEAMGHKALKAAASCREAVGTP